MYQHGTSMTEQEALTLVETLLQTANSKQGLNDVQSVVFRGTWAGLSYDKIAKQLGYQLDYIKQVGSQLWRSLSKAIGELVTKRNLQSVLRRYQQSHSRGLPLCLPSIQDWAEAIEISIEISKILSVLADSEVTAEILPKEPLRKLLEALESLKGRSLI